MKKITCAIIFATGLSSCAAGPKIKSYKGPTGEIFSNIRCTRDTSDCFEKASEVCNQSKYRVINSYRNAGGLWADIFPGPVTWYTMDIVCDSSNGVIPTFPLRGPEVAMPKLEQTNCTKIGNSINCSSF